MTLVEMVRKYGATAKLKHAVVAARGWRRSNFKTGDGKPDPKRPRSSAPGRDLRESRTGAGGNANAPKIPEGTAGEMSFLRRG